MLALRRDLRQPRKPERGAWLVDPEVEAEADHVVGVLVAAVAVPRAGGHGVRAQQPDLRRDRLVVGEHHPAFAYGELLLGEERQAGDVAARRVDAEPLRGILD